MSNVLVETMLLNEFLVKLCDFMRATCGLMVVERTKNGGCTVLMFQRVLALLWCGFFALSFMLCEKFETILHLDLKNLLIVRFLPKVTVVMSTLTFVITYIFTHAFANERKNIYTELTHISPVVYKKCVHSRQKGANYVAAFGLLQIIYCLYWSYEMYKLVTQRSFSAFAFTVIAFPRLASACFFVDYVSVIIDVLQHYVKINEDLKKMLDRSLEFRNYPKNERIFQKHITGLVNRHDTLAKIVRRINDVYSIQLLFNISVTYIFIFTSSYISLYTLLSSFTGQFAAPFVFMSSFYLGLNMLTLLFVVEITTQLCKEVEY